MRVSFKENTLTVVTNVTKATIERGLSDLVARDDKGNAQYAVLMSRDGSASIDKVAIKCNVYIDGKAAVKLVLPAAATQADVEKQYGEALVKAARYTDLIAVEADAKADTISGLFETEEAVAVAE